MKQSLWKFYYSLDKIKYSSKDKIYSVYYLNFLWIELIGNINMAFLIVVVGLLEQSWSSKRLYNWRMLLSFVIVDEILSKSMAKCHLFLLGTFKK